MDALTENDKSRCRYHLGYLASSFAASFQLGIPRPLQTVFLLESAMTLLVESGAVARVRCILDTLDNIEGQLRAATASLVASQLGNMQLHPLKDKGLLVTDSLEKEYRRWSDRLADILGVPKYPFSSRTRRSGPGSTIPSRSG